LLDHCLRSAHAHDCTTPGVLLFNKLRTTFPPHPTRLWLAHRDPSPPRTMGASPPTTVRPGPQPSLEVALRHILDNLANNDDSFPTALNSTELKLPGKRTPELRALENAIWVLIGRIKELETRHSSSSSSSSSSPIDVMPSPKQLARIKQEERKLCGNRPVCDTCGHRLENGPLTPDETPPVVDNGVPHVHTRIPSSANTSCVGTGVDV